MLVLSRFAGESIRIGDVIVQIVDIRNCRKVRLGITAPRDTPVHREEVYQAIKQQERRNDNCE
jgi:carbon storage regulator